jgi:alkylation response protein AidB-like acyl-CoA dehydrogenase
MPSAVATPLFAGALHDTALRLAQAHAGRSGADDTDAWQQMLELGWQGVLVAAEQGGAGADLADLAALVEAIATRALPVPLIDRCAVAPALLAAAIAQPAARALLERTANGAASVAPALHAAPQQHGSAPAPTLGDDGRLRGTVAGVDWSVPATHLVFDARGAGDVDNGLPALVLLDAQELASRMRRYVGIDGRTCADIDVEGVAVPAGHVLLRGPAAAAAVDAAEQLGSLLGCASTVGACGAMIEQTIDYLNTRVQFGTALSTFQALRHRVVDMYVAYESARGLVREQVLLHAEAPDARQVALTRLYVQQVGRTLGESTIQLHGGMGMSQETLAARLALHVFSAGLRFGDRSDCLDWLVERLAAEPLAA